MEDHQANVIAVKEGSKSSNEINPMEDEVIVVKEESKSSDASNPMEDEVIVVKEESKSSNAINSRYLNKKVLVYSLVLCLLLSIFLASKKPSFQSNINMARSQYGKLIKDFLAVPAILFLLLAVVISFVITILYIQLVSGVISVVEACFVSWNVAIVVLIFSVVIIAAIVKKTRKQHSHIQ